MLTCDVLLLFHIHMLTSLLAELLITRRHELNVNIFYSKGEGLNISHIMWVADHFPQQQLGCVTGDIAQSFIIISH